MKVRITLFYASVGAHQLTPLNRFHDSGWIDFTSQSKSLRFCFGYNTEHHHSALNYVTPQQRHDGEADQILAQRKQVIEAAKAENPRRWSGDIRNFSLPESVTLNPEKAANC